MREPGDVDSFITGRAGDRLAEHRGVGLQLVANLRRDPGMAETEDQGRSLRRNDRLGQSKAILKLVPRLDRRIVDRRG